MLQASFTKQSIWPSQADAVGLPFCPRIPLGELGNCSWVLLANTDWIGSANNPQRQREGNDPLSLLGPVWRSRHSVEWGGAGVPMSWCAHVRWSRGALRGDGRQADHTSCEAVVLCSWGELQAHSGRLSRRMGGHWCCFSRTSPGYTARAGTKTQALTLSLFKGEKKPAFL